ncbi:MAG: plasmid pRiA4b ORF-3 family protein [Thiomicrospira sp.]|jgi:hypothetical protein|nr:plasmid pRiA4b ORF-3 family protein [Thiomicrospira sp.]
MILNLTKPNYRSLVELLALAEIMFEKIEGSGLAEPGMSEAYHAFMQSIFRHADKMDAADAIEFDPDDKQWHVTDSLYEFWDEQLQIIERADFVNQLAVNLAFREDEITGRYANVKKIPSPEKMIAQAQQTYEKQLERLMQNGLGLLECLDKTELKKRYPKLDVEDFLANQARVLQQGFNPEMPDDLDDFFQTDPEPDFEPKATPVKTAKTNSKVVPLHPQAEQLGLEAFPGSDELMFELKLSVKEAKPAIWRKVLVPANISLAKLHKLIQIVFNFEDYHLHQFTYNRQEISKSAETRTALNSLLVKQKQKLDYAYDFGDGWEFTIQLEKVHPNIAALENSLAQVIDGARGGLYEDIGGIWAINDLVSALTKNQPIPPHLEDLDLTVEDLTYCDIDGYNATLKKKLKAPKKR